MAAGFGSQGNFLLLKKVACGEARIADQKMHDEWLASVAGLPNAECELRGRVLAIKDESPGTILSLRRPSTAPPRMASSAPPRMASSAPPRIASSAPLKIAGSQPPPIGGTVALRPASYAPERVQSSRPTSNHGGVGAANGACSLESSAPPLAKAKSATAETVFGVIGEVTGFQAEMLDLEMDVEADLGVDTVKQATILAKLFERFNRSQDAGFRLSEFPTIRKIVEHFEGPLGVQEEEGPGGPGDGVSRVDAPVPHQASGDRPAPAAATVLRVVSDVTGFDVESLTSDMALESDLGIDTVKQATILATLGEKLGTSDPQGFRLSEFPTIGDIIRVFGERLGEAAREPVHGGRTAEATPGRVKGETDADFGPPPLPSERADAAPKPAVLASPRLEQAVAEIVARVAHYPPEMVEPDVTLRDDMALDAGTIAQLRNSLVEAFCLRENWALVGNPSVAEVVQSIRRAQVAGPPVLEARADVSRQVLRLLRTPLGRAVGDLSGKRAWVVGDHGSVVDRIRAVMASKGAECEGFAFPTSGSTDNALEAARQIAQRGAPDIVVDATACGVALTTMMSAPEACAAMERSVASRFALYKQFAQTGNVPSRILAVTAIDGSFGLAKNQSGVLEPAFGLYSGFYKALRREWTVPTVSIVDVKPSDLDRHDEGTIGRIVAELCGSGFGVEVCYPGSKRHRLVVEDQAFSVDSDRVAREFDGSDVVLVTGGGAGITSCVVRELGSRGAPTFILTGRTEIVADVERYANMSAADLKTEKSLIGTRLADGGQRVTPVTVDREFKKIERSVEIHRTMEALRAQGCDARYYVADIREFERMKEILDEVRSTIGPITALIHGAGIELSRPLKDKNWREFLDVVGVKAFGAINLTSLCQNDPIRLVVAFSSLAGRFGSAAQVDYSAANGFLDQWARAAGRQEGRRGISLVWSGWGSIGMASRSSFVVDEAETMGLNLIDPQDGARVAVREMGSATGPVDILVHRGLGPFNDSAMMALDLTHCPLIDRVDVSPSGITAVHRRFSPRRDAFLDQHRFSGTALMPGVGLMELMAEAYGLLEPGREGAIVFRSLEFSDALLFHRERARDVMVQITGDALPHRYRMVVSSPFKAVLATTAEERQYSQSVVAIEARDGSEAERADWHIGEGGEIGYKSVLAGGSELAKNVVFGALFNDARGEDGKASDPTLRWSERGICTPVRLPKAQLNNPRYPLEQLRLNPAFLDALHQAGAVWGMLVLKEIYLPSSAEEFMVLRTPNVDGEYRVVARAKEVNSDRIVFDLAMWNSENALCCCVKNSMFRRVRQ